MSRQPHLGLRLRVVLEPDIAIGPGKADLLEGIARPARSPLPAGAWA
ncbi:MAG: hypothetical protein R3D28_11130 [Geminicoccaceae bacterium]